MDIINCEHKSTEIIDSISVCKGCGWCSSEIFVPDSHDLYEGRTLVPKALDGTRIEIGVCRSNPSVERVIHQITSSLGLDSTETKIISLYNMVEKKFQVGEGQLLRVVIGACALLAIREEKIPKTMREVAFTLGVELQQLASVVHKIRMHFMPSVPSFIDIEILVNKAIYEIFENQVNKINLPIYVDIMQLDHLKQDVQTFRIPRDNFYFRDNISCEEFQEQIMKCYRKVFTELCTQILKYANEDNIVSGKQPSPVGAAIVLIAIEATEKPSAEEWKNNHKRVSEIIGKKFQVDSHLVMNDRYKEIIDLIHHKVVDLPWSYLAKENKNRSYLYVVDLVQFHEWILNSREKGKRKQHVLLNDEELEEYLRNDNEVEFVKNSWVNSEGQNENVTKKAPKKRKRMLREIDTSQQRKIEDQVSDSQTDTFENNEIDTRKKRAKVGSKKREGSPTPIVPKINFDPNAIDMNLFNHI
ncbi:1196_t:CDS:2 [Diversispora eburnea]|uniref:1196_t:CDS:1 n=1 Tax=Diversispora eburnea TaxID=1213867 RepID=A0A9N9AL12_9GLOM|nr:1196_t:CDS:2 [Diversispora eburnea]